MKERLSRETIAMRAAKELFDGAVDNLGIGIPTLVSSFIPEGMEVTFHTENGALAFGPVELCRGVDVIAGACYFHSSAFFLQA